MSGLRLAVLISGRGSNLEAILRGIETGSLPAKVTAVLSDDPDAAGLELAARRGIRTMVVRRPDFDGRESFESALVAACRESGAELICLAGFMRLLGPAFLGAFPGRIMNIHPSLLPSFPGLHAQRQALEYGVRVSGCTVHFVTTEMDMGPVILQACVPVHPGDDEETLSQRILAREHEIYQEAIGLFAAGRLRISGRRVEVD